MSRCDIQTVCSAGSVVNSSPSLVCSPTLPYSRTPGPVDPAAELEREQLRAVTDAEGRDAELEDRRVELRSAVGVHRRGPAREDQRGRVAAPKLVDGDAVRDELGVDARLAHAARDQLRVLPAEVDDQHGPAVPPESALRMQRERPQPRR